MPSRETGVAFLGDTMIVTLEEMKQYLRVDYPDDDALLSDIISAAVRTCMAVARISDEEEFMESANVKIAVMYAVAYLYEHREEADHKALNLSLRALLLDIRQEGF